MYIYFYFIIYKVLYSQWDNVVVICSCKRKYWKLLLNLSLPEEWVFDIWRKQVKLDFNRNHFSLASVNWYTGKIIDRFILGLFFNYHLL